MIRLLLAGMASFAALLGCAGLAFSVLPKNASPVLLGLGLGVALVVIAGISLVIFNLGRISSTGPTLEQMKADGLVESTEYRATRAFELEEFEDEGSHYFVELDGGSVLYLNGQYLYEHNVPHDSCGTPRVVFPTTEFAILRHRTYNCVLDVVCRGAPLKLEVIAPSFGSEHYESENQPVDGDVIRDRSYEQIKADCIAGRG